MKISSRTLLLVILVVVVAIYLFVKRSCSLSCSSVQNFLGLDEETEPKDVCSWLAQDGYSKSAVSSCRSYNKICGEGSGASEALNISESYDPTDPRVDQSYKSDVAQVSQNPKNCAEPLKCGPVADPSGQTYTWDVANGVWVPNPQKMVDTPCPNFLKCTGGACL